MKMTRVARSTAAAAVAVVLLSGCADEGAGGGAKPPAAPTAEGKSSGAAAERPADPALEERFLTAALPGDASLPGWTRMMWNVSTPDGEYPEDLKKACRNNPTARCRNIMGLAEAFFDSKDQTKDVLFRVFSYSNEKSAAAAYDSAWTEHAEATHARTSVKFGALGERRDAFRAPAAYRPGMNQVFFQVQVGRNLVQIAAQADAKTPLADAVVEKMASVAVQCSREAQQGVHATAAAES